MQLDDAPRMTAQNVIQEPKHELAGNSVQRSRSSDCIQSRALSR
jgi:hypothetical protein